MNLVYASGRGLRAAMPICLGYIPVAITFGAAATSFGYPLYVPILFSATIFAGGSQFILLTALQNGTPWVYVVALCALIDSRHVIYGSLIRRIFPESLAARVPLAMSLTDEVFATALTQRDKKPTRELTAWLVGVALTAYLCWVLSTAIGGAVGTLIQDSAPTLTKGLHFALPALFLALSLDNLDRTNAWPLAAGAICAFGTILVGNNIAVTLFAAIAASVACCCWQHRAVEP